MALSYRTRLTLACFLANAVSLGNMSCQRSWAQADLLQASLLAFRRSSSFTSSMSPTRRRCQRCRLFGCHASRYALSEPRTSADAPLTTANSQVDGNARRCDAPCRATAHRLTCSCGRQRPVRPCARRSQPRAVVCEHLAARGAPDRRCLCHDVSNAGPRETVAAANTWQMRSAHGATGQRHKARSGAKRDVRAFLRRGRFLGSSRRRRLLVGREAGDERRRWGGLDAPHHRHRVGRAFGRGSRCCVGMSRPSF